MASDQTRDLHLEQERRAAREERLAEESDQPTEEAEHRRRSDKAEYLKAKLEERARSEREQ